MKNAERGTLNVEHGNKSAIWKSRVPTRKAFFTNENSKKLNEHGTLNAEHRTKKSVN